VEAKAHLRVDSSDDDTLITNLIRAAREYAEDFQNRAYVVRTYELLFDDAIPETIYPPYPPLVSVSSITYVDTDGVTQTVTASVYDVDTKSEPGRIYEAYGQSWPSSIRAVNNTIAITCVAGYLTKITNVDAETDYITITGRTFADTDKVRISTSHGTKPTGLELNTDYYVRDWDAANSKFKLAATSGGAAIDITDAGSGTRFIGELPEQFKVGVKLLLGHLYENREQTAAITLEQIPIDIHRLLRQNKVW
jgi:uncharacterized phiE125 gp8 family phage protein